MSAQRGGPSGRVLGPNSVPVEIQIQIFRNLDIQSIFRLARVCDSLHTVFLANKSSILLPVLRDEFSPFDELMHVYAASGDDVDSETHVCRRKTVIYKRRIDDPGLVLCEGSVSLAPQLGDDGFKVVTRNRAVPGNTAPAKSTTVHLRDGDLESIIRHCQLVRKWEELFPQMRWINQPENCRFLSHSEIHRFRRALYRWWLYAIYFHGGLRRPRSGQPEAFVDDMRTSQMRQYPTSELLELLDLVATVKDMIEHYIFPTLVKDVFFDVGCGSGARDAAQSELPQLRWGDTDMRDRVLKTYAKLDPGELMHYFENLYSFSKSRLIADVKLRHPTFTMDQESLQAAIRAALDERPYVDNLNSLFATNVAGGIVDFGDSRDVEKGRLSFDASPDGSLPSPAKFIRPRLIHSPRGDDGDCLEDALDAAWMLDREAHSPGSYSRAASLEAGLETPWR